MTKLHLSFLGPPQIALDGEPVHFESRKAVALLAYLAVSEGRHRRAELALLLWPESDSKRARGALRYTLSIIRSALGDGWLTADRNHVGLRAPVRPSRPSSDASPVGEVLAIESDVAEFRRLLQTPELADGTPGAAAAAALYRDDFLSGFSLRDSDNFDEWQFFQREDFRQQLIGGLADLVQAAGERGDFAAAVQLARRLLHLDPLREDIQRMLMTLLADSGQIAAAIQQFDEYAAHLNRELGVPPSPPTVALADSLRDRFHRRQAPAIQEQRLRRIPTNLSGHSEQAVGRELELQAIHNLLDDPECRVLTLIGAGGMGKTRLAQQVAADLVGQQAAADARVPARFPDGVYWTPLAAITSRDLLIAAIAGALGLQFVGPEPLQTQLFNALQQRRMLLVLDNFEQLASEAGMISDLLNACPQVKVLVTSRERLKLYAEWLFEVTSLAVPSGKLDERETAVAQSALHRYGSVALFCRRARRINPHFRPEPVLGDVVRICRLVEGMPLGIELAAGWIRTLTAADIADQIQANLDFLTTELQDVPSRHRSLRAVYRYSFARLTDEEQAVFARLTVFRGGFDGAAAAEIAGANQLVLARLVDKSMLQRAARPAAASQTLAPPPVEGARYLIHELLRQFGVAELTADVRIDVRRTHARYYADLLRRLAETRHTMGEADALHQVEREFDNVIAAWEWLLDEYRRRIGDDGFARSLVTAAPMLSCYFQRRARFQEGCDLFNRALAAIDTGQDRPQDDAWRLLRAELQVRLAEQLFSLSEFDRVIQLCEQAEPALQAGTGARTLGESLWLRGTAYIRIGDYGAAESTLEDSLAVLRSAGEDATAMVALNGLGIAYSNQGLYERARPIYEEFLALARASGYTRGIANALNNLGSNYARSGDPAGALPCYQKSYELSMQCGEQLLIAVALSNAGSMSRALNAYDDARRYYADSLAISRTIGERRWTVANLNGLGLTLVESGATAEAAGVLAESLLLARDIGSVPDALDAMATVGHVAHVMGCPQIAESLWRYVVAHPNSMSQARQRSRQQLTGTADGASGSASTEREPSFALDNGTEIESAVERVHALLQTWSAEIAGAGDAAGARGKL